MNEILGQRADVETAKLIRELLTQEPEVKGAYDLILNNYGPNKNYGSVHLELPDTMTVEEVDVLTRRVQNLVYKETGVVLTGVGVYSFNTKDEEAAKIRTLFKKWFCQMHGHCNYMGFT